jgi:hydroxymethylbilane synthase
MAKNRPLRIASRGSPLARWQAEYFAELVKPLGFATEILYIKTTGDQVQDRFLHEIGGKGLFIKELETALLQGTADVAIHSLKDMPAVLQPGFVLPAYLPRHSAKDLLIFRPQMLTQTSLSLAGLMGQEQPDLTLKEFESLPGGIIATGSLRRQHLINHFHSGFTCEAIRGNVDTRLAKLKEHPSWLGLVLAEASLDRLQLKGQWQARALDPTWFVPAPAQGILALECREDYPQRETLRQLNCPGTERQACVERGLLAMLGGDCTLPYACHMFRSASRDQLAVRIFTASQLFSFDLSMETNLGLDPILSQLRAELLKQDREGLLAAMLRKGDQYRSDRGQAPQPHNLGQKESP